MNQYKNPNFDQQGKIYEKINGNHNRSSKRMQMNFNSDLYVNQQLPHYDRFKLV